MAVDPILDQIDLIGKSQLELISLSWSRIYSSLLLAMFSFYYAVLLIAGVFIHLPNWPYFFIFPIGILAYWTASTHRAYNTEREKNLTFRTHLFSLAQTLDFFYPETTHPENTQGKTNEEKEEPLEKPSDQEGI